MVNAVHANLSAKDRLILAVDTSNIDEARRIVDELYEYVGVFKVGLELFMNGGPQVLKLFHQLHLKTFFDCKLLDIPNTVAKATEAVTRLEAFMFTVHATGGAKMLAACAQAASRAASEAGVSQPISLGVTVLTSLDAQMLKQELNVGVPMEKQVVDLATLCKDNGIKGIVASAAEVKELRTKFGDSMVLVTPGVRPSFAEANDQSRVVTPGQALKDGSDYLVIGRPITQAKDPVDAVKRIIEEMQQALE